MAKVDPPNLLDLDALLTDPEGDEQTATWNALVRSAEAANAWRQAQRLRVGLDAMVVVTGRFPWLVAPWSAIRATRRLVTAALPTVLAGDLPAARQLALGVLGPTGESAQPDRVVTLRWGGVVEVALPVGTVIGVRASDGRRLDPLWRSSLHLEPVVSRSWRLESGEMPVLAVVTQDGASAGLIVLQS